MELTTRLLPMKTTEGVIYTRTYVTYSVEGLPKSESATIVEDGDKFVVCRMNVPLQTGWFKIRHDTMASALDALRESIATDPTPSVMD